MLQTQTANFNTFYNNFSLITNKNKLQNQKQSLFKLNSKNNNDNSDNSSIKDEEENKY